jgi:hypothetical protein
MGLVAEEGEVMVLLVVTAAEAAGVAQAGAYGSERTHSILEQTSSQH